RTPHEPRRRRIAGVQRLRAGMWPGRRGHQKANKNPATAKLMAGSPLALAAFIKRPQAEINSAPTPNSYKSAGSVKRKHARARQERLRADRPTKRRGPGGAAATSGLARSGAERAVDGVHRPG